MMEWGLFLETLRHQQSYFVLLLKLQTKWNYLSNWKISFKNWRVRGVISGNFDASTVPIFSALSCLVEVSSTYVVKSYFTTNGTFLILDIITSTYLVLGNRYPDSMRAIISVWFLCNKIWWETKFILRCKQYLFVNKNDLLCVFFMFVTFCS